MNWEKKGLVYAPSGDLWWAKTYAMLPTATLFSEQILRVYFASLDENRYGRIGYVDLDADNPLRILNETKEPILDLGELGSFDDSGVNPCCILDVAGTMYLYYNAWQRCERVPYMLFTGLAQSHDGGTTFKKYSRTPILDRTDEEPFSRSAPFVTKEDGIFKMWYWSSVEWSQGRTGIHYNGVIRYASSSDGIHWNTHPSICIKPNSPDEYSVGRPWVLRDGRLYRMWYSMRSFSKLYSIGYAESEDGIQWERKDAEAGISRSDSGWDSEMICYPCVVDVRGKRYMFYCGNRHGSTGFGCAVLEA